MFSADVNGDSLEEVANAYQELDSQVSIANVDRDQLDTAKLLSEGLPSADDFCTQTKRSERLRIKNQKGNSNFSSYSEEFVYNLDELNWGPPEECRSKVNSWSNTGAAVVERRLIKGKHTKTPEPKGVSGVSSSKKRQQKEEYERKQNKLTQKRIDLLFQRKEIGSASTSFSDEDTEVYFKSRGVSELDAFTHSDDIREYGSDLESYTQPRSTLRKQIKPAVETDSLTTNIVESALTSAARMARNTEELEREMELPTGNLDSPLLVKHWDGLLDRMQKMIKEEFTSQNKKREEDMKKVVQQTVQQELSSTKTQLKMCQVQLNEVIGITVRQSQEIA